MALLLTRSAMVHTPKTGGMWCYRVLFEQGLVRGNLQSPGNYPHPSAAEVTQIVGPDMFLFAFVRHPVEWLRSYWAASCIARGLGVERIRFGQSPWADFAACEAPTFLDFALTYLERCPGAVGRLFERYTTGVAFIGRQETLQVDLAEALRLAGEPFDREQAAAVPAVNRASARGLGAIAELPRSIDDAIRAAERACLARYYRLEER
jgi:hypothetical protein